ncbi:hypothetical protein V6R21_15705 [Limibacter armeniacum]|uniref:hypothetical protein n=1 Tax=Limibacter armeniacum TaxID=466084 RepID=UPI002FE694B0
MKKQLNTFQPHQQSTLFTLPTYISGFTEEGVSPLNHIEPYEFRLFLSRQKGVEILSFHDFETDYDCSYMLSLVEMNDDKFLIFCNKYFPYVAVSKVLEEGVSLKDETAELPRNRFVKDIGLSEIDDLPFSFLEVELLELKVDADNADSMFVLKQISDTEFAEFSYWQPLIIADIIFNRWTKKRQAL